MYSQGMVRRTFKLALLVTCVLLALSACGEGGDAQQQAEARSLPEYPKELRPGEYYTEEFKPSLSFNVGKDWWHNCGINLGDAPLGSHVGGQFVLVQARGGPQGPDYVYLHRPRGYDYGLP